jgi:hypothetical protein
MIPKKVYVIIHIFSNCRAKMVLYQQLKKKKKIHKKINAIFVPDGFHTKHLCLGSISYNAIYRLIKCKRYLWIKSGYRYTIYLFDCLFLFFLFEN